MISRLPSGSSFGKTVDELLADIMTFVALPYFLLGEVSTAQQRNAQRVEVVLIDATEVGAKRLIDEAAGRPSTVKRHVVELTTEWKLGNQTNCFDARQAGERVSS